MHGTVFAFLLTIVLQVTAINIGISTSITLSADNVMITSDIIRVSDAL